MWIVVIIVLTLWALWGFFRAIFAPIGQLIVHGIAKVFEGTGMSPDTALVCARAFISAVILLILAIICC